MGRWMHCVLDLFVRLCVPGGGFSGWLIGDFYSSIYIYDQICGACTGTEIVLV